MPISTNYRGGHRRHELFGGRGALLGTFLGAAIVGAFRTGLALGQFISPSDLGHGSLHYCFSVTGPMDPQSASPALSASEANLTPLGAAAGASVMCARSIVKIFGPVLALDAVDLDLHRGEVRNHRR